MELTESAKFNKIMTVKHPVQVSETKINKQIKELVVLTPGEWLSNLVYCCDNRWRPNHVVTHGHKTQHVFDMDENNSVGITTSENSWNRACHVSSYYSILFGCWTIYPK